ncbi:hypothetical protein N7513_012763 [Penicillium frequentans]|nr:hypothetical protein N7513_012763 [Penicillium glabrum]
MYVVTAGLFFRLQIGESHCNVKICPEQLIWARTRKILFGTDVFVVNASSVHLLQTLNCLGLERIRVADAV